MPTPATPWRAFDFSSPGEPAILEPGLPGKDVSALMGGVGRDDPGPEAVLEEGGPMDCLRIAVRPEVWRRSCLR